MSRNLKRTPFPTGLFKSRAFLRKVEAAMVGDVKTPKIDTGKRFDPQIVAIVDSRGKCVAKMIAGGKAAGVRGVCEDGVAVSVAGKAKSGLRHRPAWAAKGFRQQKKWTVARAAAKKR